ncbi:MAG: endoglucanase [Microbacteriaceae bacterium]|nr:endoglucanase [Microbacteriaceae bacterium]
MAGTGVISTSGTHFLDPAGEEILLRGVCLGGWLNMENFITGYSANESLMRREVGRVLGADRSDAFFERLLQRFFGDADAAFLGDSGFNLVRIAVGYKHFEDDARPFEIKQDGFRHLDRAIEALARNGVYSIVDLHSLPGSQNHHWHSDNPTHVPAFWQHPHFQDRVVNIWQAIAEHYRGNPWVAGYNLLNEPADETGEVVGPFYRRLVAAIREVDPAHTVFLDGNTYATDFRMFDEPFDNAVYTLHDYVPAGLGRSADYDRGAAEQKFLERSAYARATGTPILVGEFGPIYTGDTAEDAKRRRILADQLELYRQHDAGWALWMYKDIGRQGLVSVDADTAYRRRFDPFVAKKNRLGVDQWGSDGEGLREITRPVQDLVAREAPSFDPYPWGPFDWVRTLLLNITLAQPLATEYAELFRGLDDSELDALADSFSFESCYVRDSLLEQLRSGLVSTRP